MSKGEDMANASVRSVSSARSNAYDAMSSNNSTDGNAADNVDGAQDQKGEASKALDQEDADRQALKDKAKDKLANRSDDKKGNKNNSKDADDAGDGANGDSGSKGSQSGHGGHGAANNPMNAMKHMHNGVSKMAGAGNAVGKALIGFRALDLMNSALIMMGNLVNAAVAGVAGILGAIQGAITAVVGFFAGIASAIGSAVTTAVTMAISLVVVAGVAVGALTINQQNIVLRDGCLGDCSKNVNKVVADGKDVDTDGLRLQHAQELYSVFHTYGLTDNEVCGILGNFSAESGIDPTTIEGIYSEPYNINGSRHQEAMADFDSYTTGKLFPDYEGRISINKAQYFDEGTGKYYPGLGLAQITNGNRLISLCESINRNWWEMDTQLACYLACGSDITTGAKGGKEFWNTYKKDCESSSPEECAIYFAKNYEGNTILAQSERAKAAADWASQVSSWTVDSAYADNVMALAKQLGAAASDGAAGKAKSECKKAMNYDNSSIAGAAVSYAYPTKEEGAGNNGTALYQRVHDSIFPGDTIYMSCDRSVGLAVRWSGSDDTYPLSDTAAQLSYLQSSDKWQEVGGMSSLKEEDMKPGDVAVLNGHTWMYVGNEIVTKIHGDKATPGANSVSGSLNHRSPGCGVDASYYFKCGGKDNYHGGAEYHIFRCVKPDNSQTYKDAGAGA